MNYNVEEIIVKLFNKTITTDERSVLKKWIDESDENKTYLSELENLWHVSHPAFEPDEIDVAGAEKKVMATINDGAAKKRLPFFIHLQRAAAIFFVPVFLIFGYIIFRQKETLKNSELVFQEIAVPFGVSSKVSLSDGTIVWLNSGSKLRYPDVFKNDERIVYLEGEGYFEVESDIKTPFTVNVGNIRVTATGTAFNIDSYSVDSVMVVTLVNGKVKVTLDDNKEVAMKPNQQLLYFKDSSNYTITQTDTYKWCAWRDGTLVFRDDPLEYVFKKVGQMYNVEIEVMDKDIAKHQYRATFEDETLDEILNLLKMTAPIEYRKRERVKTSDGQFEKTRIEIYKIK